MIPSSEDKSSVLDLKSIKAHCNLNEMEKRRHCGRRSETQTYILLSVHPLLTKLDEPNNESRRMGVLSVDAFRQELYRAAEYSTVDAFRQELYAGSFECKERRATKNEREMTRCW